MLKLPSGPKHRGSLQKKKKETEGNNLFARNFRANLDEKTLIWFNLQRDGTGNGLFNIKDTFAESLQLQKMSVLHQRICIFRSSRLVSQVHMMAGQNIKKNYLMCHIPIKMLKQHVIPNSSLHNLKIYSPKRCRK